MAGLASCSDDLSQPPIIEPEGGIGTGKWDSPMTAWQCRIGAVNPQYSEPWVTGYIVGVVNTNVGNVLNERCAQFEAPFETNTNLLIAMTPDETDWEKCATVQLPKGGVRDALNLVDNDENLGKQVTMRGTTGTKYCGAYGIRDVSDYNWGDKGKEEAEIQPVDGPFFENFDASTSFDPYKNAGWRNVVLSGGLSGWYITNFNGNNYIATTAYKGSATGGPYENWLITPAIDLSKLTEKTIEFVTQAAYPAEDCTLEVYAMTGDSPKTSTNTRLQAVIAVPPANTSGSPYSDWVSSGKIDLSQFSGTIRIGWRFWSAKGGEGNSSTYCIDNISVGGATAPDTPDTPDTPDNPPTPPTPGSGTVYEGLSANADGWTFDNILLPAGISYAWKWDGNGYLKGTVFTGSGADSESIAWSPVISLTGATGAEVTFDHTAKYQTTLRSLCKFVVRVEGETDYTELPIPVWPEPDSWKFVSSGKISLSDFDGKQIRIGFKYASSTDGADTWEVKNVKVTANK